MSDRGAGDNDKRIALRVVEQLLGGLGPPPKTTWVVVLIVAAFLSTFEVTRVADGGVTFTFRLTPITALLIGLLWLPTVIRVGALGGGTLKTPAGEATLTGIPIELLRELDVETQREALPGLIAVADAVEARATPANAPALHELRTALEEHLAALAPDAKAAREQLDEYARRYDELRKTMPSGPQRTWEMTRLMSAARALVPQAAFTSAELRNKLASSSEGQRIVALAAMQTGADPAQFDLALDAIENSRSAFEQYHGLLAIDSTLDRLTPQQRGRLREVLEKQRSQEKGGWITPADPSRWDLSGLILKRL